MVETRDIVILNKIVYIYWTLWRF